MLGWFFKMASIFLSPRLILKAIFPGDPIHPGAVRLRKLNASENNKKRTHRSKHYFGILDHLLEFKRLLVFEWISSD